MKLPVSWDYDFFHINLYSWRHWWRQQVTKKVQFWNCYISINISDTASIKISKYRKCSWLSCWYIQLPVLLPVNKFVATSKWRPFWKIWKHQTQLQFHLSYVNIVPNYAKKYFSWWWRHRWCHRVTWKLPSIFMFRRGSLWEQVARAMPRQYMRIS